MSLETDVQELTQATTDLLVAVNVSKATLDGKVEDAGDFATASLNSANASAASAATATTQATAAGTARTGAETARDAAVVAQNNAVAVVTGGTATLTPSATKIPLSDAQGKIAKGWLTNTDLVEQTDIGTAPNEIPLNQYLGEMAYMDAQNIPTLGINVANAATANVVNLMQVTEISNAVPSLNLDFAKVKQLDPRITFTRASTGTYYDGKTVAKAEENLLLWSQNFGDGVWAKTRTTQTSDTTTAPDGSTTADTLVETAVDGNHVLQQLPNVTNGVTYTFSCYLKKGVLATAPDIVQLAAGGTGFASLPCVNFNLSTGVVTVEREGAVGSITSAGNGWWRCTLTRAATGTGIGNLWVAFTNNNPTSLVLPSYAGSTTSDVFLWGAQLEQRSTATAYTPTTTQPITNYIPQLMTAASGVPRFEHNPITRESLGLEIEEQRTNLLTYSDDLSNIFWFKDSGTVEVNSTVAPDGTSTADKYVPNTSSATDHRVRKEIPVTAVVNYSCYVKAAGYSWVKIRAGTGWANINLADGTVGFNANATNISVQSVGNGWFRCSLSANVGASTFVYVYPLPNNATNEIDPAAWAGNGFSGIYIWGAQLEAGAFPTSYIPTVASQVTRAADSAVMTGANFSSWYRQAEGTVFIENNYNFGSAANSGSRIALQLDNGSSNDRFVLSNGGQANSLVAQVGSVLQAYYDGAPHTANFVKTAFGYATNNMAVSNSGSIPATDTSCLVPIVNTMRIGMFSNGALQLNGTIKKITYYPQRLSNAELVEMTA